MKDIRFSREFERKLDRLEIRQVFIDRLQSHPNVRLNLMGTWGSLIASIDWLNTPEGYEYWARIAQFDWRLLDLMDEFNQNQKQLERKLGILS